jgi:hypothetical protein
MLWSEAYRIDGAQQVGVASTMDGRDRASLWSGSAASWVNLHPSGAFSSRAYDVDGGQQAGIVGTDAGSRASHWGGTAASWVNLHPGFLYSHVYGVDAGAQAGSVSLNATGDVKASLWTGTAASWMNLSPPGTVSEAFGIDAGQQVGWVNRRAALWSGTAASWVDLHPLGAAESVALGVHGGWQAGWATHGSPPGARRACVWRGTAASWQALPLPPGSWDRSEATDVWTGGTTIHVVGWGINESANRYEALLWTWTPAAAVSGGVGLGGWTAPLTGRTVTFEIRAPGTTAPLQTAVVSLSASGEFTFTTPLPAGTYDVTAKSDRWLRARLQNVAFTAAGASGLAFGELIPGDVVEDNAVDLADFLALAATYEASPPTEARADLNGDGSVDLADFLLLAAHYEAVGAP